MTQRFYGLDVSSWQGSEGSPAIDWHAVAENGISFVSVKQTESIDYINPHADEQVNGAREAGIAVGGYHFARPANIAMQVSHFVGEANSRGLFSAGSLWPMLDIEDPAITAPNDFVAAFASTLQIITAGAGLLVYSELAWFKDQLNPDLWASDKVKLWVAEWNGDPGHPDYTHDHLVLHQHTNQGSVPGIPGFVDRDATMDGVDLSAVLIDPGRGPGGGPAPAPTPPPAPLWEPYTIRPGDTLTDIANRYGTTVSVLAAHNGISNPNLIFANTTIEVPAHGQSGGTQYQIQPGDTLSMLAARWGTSVEAIVDLNHISDPNVIYAGDWLTQP